MLGTEDEFRCPACNRVTLVKHDGQKPLFCSECGRNIVDWENSLGRFPYPERLIVGSMATKLVKEPSEDQEDRILREYYARRGKEVQQEIMEYNKKWAIKVIKEGPKPAAELLDKIANKIHDTNFSTQLTETQRLKELHDLDAVLEVFIFSLPYNGPWDKIFEDAKAIRQGLASPNKTQHRMRDLADGARLELEVTGSGNSTPYEDAPANTIPYSQPKEAGSQPKSRFDVIDSRIDEVEKVQTALVGAFLKTPIIYEPSPQISQPSLTVTDNGGCGLLLGILTLVMVCGISVGLILNHISEQKESKAPNFWNGYQMRTK